MLNVQKFLHDQVANGKVGIEPFQALTDQFGIKYTIYPEDALVILNYDQIESPKAHPIVIECRSIILNPYTFEVVSRKFDRFFNAGEVPDFYHDFDISRSRVYCKEDGSLVGVYHNPTTGRWEISTRGMAKAEGTHVSGISFRQAVLNSFGVSEEEFQYIFANAHGAQNTVFLNTTFIFEYTGPENRVVRRYDESKMVMTWMRNHQHTNFYPDETINSWCAEFYRLGLNVRVVESYALNTIEGIVEAAKNLPALEEGYVVFDPVSGKRQKIKNPSYVAIHGLRENGALSMKRVYSLVLLNDHEEYLNYFPEDRNAFGPVILAVAEFEDSMVTLWERVRYSESQKDFALALKGVVGSGCFFSARKKNTTPLHEFHNLEMMQKLKLFGY